MTITLMRKGCTSCCFQANSQRQKTSEDCCNVLFPQIRQQLTNKMKKEHQLAIEEKDAAIALLNDDLQNCEYENVGSQGEIRAKDEQIVVL